MGEGNYMFNKILCAYDGSEHAKKALQSVMQLCKENSNAELHILHTIKFEPIPTNIYGQIGVTVDQNEYIELTKKYGEQILTEAINLVQTEGLKAHGLLFYGDPAATILEFATENSVDLIVMGSRGLSTFKELFLGSVSHKITQSAKCSVLIVK